jgi:polyisoprenyl-teichoic acid--peptidoglycan teichoic acid transferase
LRSSSNWLLVYFLAAIAGGLIGVLVTLVYRPNLLPPFLQFGSLHGTSNILFLGTDVVYSGSGGRKKADHDAFTGRSDTIMFVRLDPMRNSIAVLSIPRDTQAAIPGYGTQKINAANAYGGPKLAVMAVNSLVEPLQVDHYVVLNVHGLVDLVDELGGITVDVPKRMHYMDWTAKLKIDLEPGVHTLTGNQAMGFVRFRHDGLGDIGRVQRQQIFVRAVLAKGLEPTSWIHIPRLIDIAQRYISTDMSPKDLLKVANFVRGVPKKNQYLAMLPGQFSGTGDWLADRPQISKMVARMLVPSFGGNTDRDSMRVSIVNVSSSETLAYRLSRILRRKGYNTVTIKAADHKMKPLQRSRFIAQLGNPDDAVLLRNDLNDCGDVVNASVGDIHSAVTIWAGDDLAALLSSRDQR